jgi:hypothetical protein
MYNKKQLENIITKALSYGLTDIVISISKNMQKIISLKSEDTVLPHINSDEGAYIRFKQNDSYKVISFSKKLTIKEIEEELEKYKIKDIKINFSFKMTDKDSNLSKIREDNNIKKILKKYHSKIIKLGKDTVNHSST